MRYCYPPAVSFRRKLRVLTRLDQNPIHIIYHQIKKYGDSYSLASVFYKDRIIFTQNAELMDYVMRANGKNYEKSFFQTDTLAKFVGRGLLTNKGESWLRQRRLIQPGFKKGRMEGIMGLMQESIDQWLNDLPKNKSIDLYPHFNQLTFKIMGRTLFGDSINEAQMLRLAEIITELQHLYARITRHPYFLWFYKINGKYANGMRLAQEGRNILKDLIEKRKNAAEEHHDLLQMLMESRYEDNGETMDQETLIDEVMILFVAGHETSANALSFTFYLLGKHPKYQEKIANYVANLGETSLDFQHYFQPGLLSQVLNESMRLFPPAWIVDRQALNDDELGDYRWKKGTIFMGFIYGLHRNPKYWDNPNNFQPERFKNELPNKRAFVPFGAGQRFCIGSHFAMMEMQMTLQYFFTKYRFNAREHDLETEALVTLRPEKVFGEVVKR